MTLRDLFEIMSTEEFNESIIEFNGLINPYTQETLTYQQGTKNNVENTNNIGKWVGIVVEEWDGHNQVEVLTTKEFIETFGGYPVIEVSFNSKTICLNGKC